MDGWLFESFMKSERDKEKARFINCELTQKELQTRSDLLDEIEEDYINEYYKIHVLGDFNE